MPKRKYIRRRSFKRKYRRIGRRVKKLERGVKKINNSIETKHIENTVDRAAITTLAIGTGIGGTFQFISSQIPQGIDSHSRIGTEIYLTSLSFNYTFELGDTNYNEVRMLIIMDKEWNGGGANPQLANYLETVGTGTTYVDLMSGYNWERRKRYRVLYDKILKLTPTYPILTVRKTIKIKRKVYYKDGLSALVSVLKNNLFIVWYSDSSGPPNPTVSGWLRIKYKDA